ncbi:MAG TPA: phage tail protein [Myxococcota bacterium]|nr:phage tail protein [Myxococcota bacterium]
MNGPQLPVPSGKALPAVPGDFLHVETVVKVGYPARHARTYLRRNLGNRIQIQLVEAKRGEKVGHVRAAQINPAAGGDPVFIRAMRCLPDGSPASLFIPDDLVDIKAELITVDGRPPPPLDPGDEVVLHVPVRSYLRFLPGAFQGGMPTRRRDIVKADEVSARRWSHQDEVTATEVRGVDTDTMRRLLFIFQHQMTTVLDRITEIPSLTDPLTCDPRFLSWIASWVGFTLDEGLPLHQQRELVRRAIRLYRTRGTRGGLEEMIKVLTAAPVSVSPREKPQPFVLGAATLAGGGTPSERYLNDEPPAHYLYRAERAAINFFALVLERRDRFDQRFRQRGPGVLKRIAQVVTNERPAHVTFTIRFDEE